MPPFHFEGLDEARQQLIPSLLNPSDHRPVICDFSLATATSAAARPTEDAVPPREPPLAELRGAARREDAEAVMRLIGEFAHEGTSQV